MKLKLPTHQENELVELLKLQDRKAFNYLYDNYSHALYGIVLKIVEVEETAQDLLQDIFVKIWKNIRIYDVKKGRLFTWMLNIARNTSIDYLRTHRIELIEIDSVRTSIEQRQSISHYHLTSTELNEAVGRLRSDQKGIIEMVYWQGYTQEEVSAMLCIPLGTVKTRLRTAIHNLRLLWLNESGRNLLGAQKYKTLMLA